MKFSYWFIKMHILYACICLLGLATSKAVSAGNSCTDAPRRKYMLAVMDVYFEGSVTDIILNIQSQQGGHVNITAPYLNISQTDSLKIGITSIYLSNSIIATTNGTEHKGILLESDIDITVRILTKSTYTGDQEGYLALPFLDNSINSFVVSSWHPITDSDFNNEFLIASAADNTTVIITSFDAYMQRTIVMNKYETYQQKFNADPSGSIVYANGPVSVFSGATCTLVVGTIFCQALVEQLSPLSSWGKTHIVPALNSKPVNIARVYTANDTATLTLSNSSSTTILYMSSFQFKELVFQNEPLVVESDKPIQVVQYGPSFMVGYFGDSFMMTIPDIGSFLTEYEFKPTELYPGYQTSHLTLTIRQTDEAGLLLNRQPITNAVVNNTVVSTLGNYSVITVLVSSGTGYELVHNVAGVTFGALLWGYAQPGSVGYGLPLGRKLRNNECLATTSATSMPQNRTSTAGLQVPTGPPATSHHGQGLTCLACDDMYHVEFCDIVQHCDENEVCFLDKYYVSGGAARFRSGCAKSTECVPGSTHLGCSYCCSESYCNSNGCGERGLSTIEGRGPVCYDCKYVTSMDECTSVRLCSPGQVCSAMEFEWGDTGFYYHLGCSDEAMCKTSSHHGRSVPVCDQCCNSDFCNTACNNTVHHQVAIIG